MVITGVFENPSRTLELPLLVRSVVFLSRLSRLEAPPVPKGETLDFPA